jgi:hypothetical protein
LAKKKAGITNPDRLPLTDKEGNVQVIIETPRTAGINTPLIPSSAFSL